METVISIHAAREGGDEKSLQGSRASVGFQSTPPVKAATAVFTVLTADFLFQSTPPVKAATAVFVNVHTGNDISIHAAREGGDFA